MSDCIFCQIIEGEIPAEKIYEDEDMEVIRDIKPKAPVHLLIISKEHIPSLNDLKEDDQELLGRMIYQAKILAEEEKIDKNGWRIIINCGQHGGQEVPHLHFHLLGGKPLGGVI